MSMQISNLSGCQFLSHIGKRVLRPGGIRVTNYLIDLLKAKYDNKKIDILEIGCHKGFTSIKIAKKINCNLYAIDIDENSLMYAKKLAVKNNLENRITFIEQDAGKLNLDNKKFDVIFCEAFLAIYENKRIFLKNFLDHLKDGGIILTHDVFNNNPEIKLESILNLEEWKNEFDSVNLKIDSFKIFDFSILTIKGLIKDEGIFRAIKILCNGLKKYNKKTFQNM